MIEREKRKEPTPASKIPDILKHVQEVSIHGKFPNGASFERSLRGEEPIQVVIETPNGGRGDYTCGDRSFERVNLVRSRVAPLIDKIELGVLPTAKENLPSSLQHDTQFLIIDTVQPHPAFVEGAEKDFAVASYRFEQAGGDRDSRPLGGVSVRAMLPHEETDKLVTALSENPDDIEDFYKGVAGGLDDNLKRIKSDRLAILDFRHEAGLPRQLLSHENGTYLQADLLCYYEAAGMIPRLPYTTDTHGIVEMHAQENPEGAVPQIDEEKAAKLDKKILDAMKRLI
jgi:hypothetical protein